MSRAEEYRVAVHEISGVKVRITSYKIEDRFCCHVANVDPGATIARAEAATREEAEKLALAEATKKLEGAAARKG